MDGPLPGGSGKEEAEMEERFADRAQAGQLLGQALMARRLPPPVLVLALPRGGVPVAAEVARALHAPLDLLLVRKIGARHQPELAVAAVADGPEPVLETDAFTMQQSGMSLQDVQQQVPPQLAEMQRRRDLYLQGRLSRPVKDHTVVLVDDGIATGTTVRAALRVLRRRGPARLVLAVPVAPSEEVARLRGEVDELVCLRVPLVLGAVGAYYRRFDQTSDAEVVAALRRAEAPA
jgi:putative phosphoribosyl transferase